MGRDVRRAAHRDRLGARRRRRRAPLGRRVRLAPFLGVIGHAARRPRRALDDRRRGRRAATSTARSSSPARRSTCRSRSTARCSPPATAMRAQGDGEVSGTAIECPSRAQLTLDVRDDLQLDWPCARIDGAWLTFGFDEDLDRAAWKRDRRHARAARARARARRREALALASVVVDLRVTQVVNGVLGVHAVLRDDAFAVTERPAPLARARPARRGLPPA